MQDAHKIVLLSAITTFSLGFLNAFTKEKRDETGDFPGPYHVRLFVGAGVVFVVLSAGADIAPKVAGPMAALIGTTALVTQGAPVIENLQSLTK